MPSADGKYISLRGKEIHYVEQPGQGVPSVLLHGQPGTYKDFEKVTPELPGYTWFRSAGLRLVPRGLAALSGPNRSGARVVGAAQTRPGDSGGSVVRRQPRARCCAAIPAGCGETDPRRPSGRGTKSTTQDLLQALFILFSHWPMVRTVIDGTVGDVIKRVSATAAATNAFAPEPVDSIYERRLLSVNMTPGNLDA